VASAVIDQDWRAASADVREFWIYHVLRREAEAMLFPNLRDQSRRWLWDEVAAWGKKLDSDPAAKESVGTALKQWRTDPDLAGLREPDFLAIFDSKRVAGLEEDG
jgi:hypothetical protein